MGLSAHMERLGYIYAYTILIIYTFMDGCMSQLPHLNLEKLSIIVYAFTSHS